jgi:D-lactate dehydrogenase (cytochrome)
MERTQFIDELRQIVGNDSIVTDAEALKPYSVDWLGVDPGNPDVAVIPLDAEQVAEIVQAAVQAGMPVVARGAGTGLAGGARPKHGGVVISTMRMTALEKADYANRTALVQPGMFNYDLSQLLLVDGYFYAPDPASWKICTLGGNVANNSGGPRCLKYGVTTNHVLGLEVVLHDGRVLWTGDGVQETAGYDLTALVIGSEGTFGVVTRLLVKLTRAPEANRVILAIFPDIVAACAAVSATLAAGYLPTALEVMDGTTMLAVNRANNYGLPETAKAALIVEVDGVSEGLDQLLAAIIAICEQHGAVQVQAASDPVEQERLWSARRSAFSSFHTLAPSYYLVDTVVPRSYLPTMMAHVTELSERYAMPIANVFHAGDGNLHPLVLYDPENPEHVDKAHAITEEILHLSINYGGVVSGEHGIGIEKREFMAQLHSLADLQAMAAVYAVFNPQNLLNPGKVFPSNMQPLRLAAERHERIVAAAEETIADLYAALSEIVGAEQLTASTDLISVAPANLAALSAVVAACHRAKAPIFTGATPIIPHQLSVQLNLSHLHEVLKYEPDDLTINVGAGMTLAELQRVLAAHNQMLPLDAPLPEQVTIGALVAQAVDGPRRTGYGALRDLILGLTIVEVDGTVTRLGGQTVKNVSGFDLLRLFLGSHETLGVIAAVNLRTYPQPPAEATVLATFASLSAAVALVNELSQSQLRPVAVELLDSGALERSGFAGTWGVALWADGLPAACQRHLSDTIRAAQRHSASSIAEIHDDDHRELWARIADLSAPTWEGDQVLLRLAVLPAQLRAAISDITALAQQHGAIETLNARAYNGVIYARLRLAANGLAAVQVALSERWRHSHVLAAAPGSAANVAIWGAPRPGTDLMQALKTVFDPFGTLNPNRMPWSG